MGIAQVGGHLGQLMAHGDVVAAEGVLGEVRGDQIVGELAKGCAVEGFQLVGLHVEPDLGHLPATAVEVAAHLGVVGVNGVQVDQGTHPSEEGGIADQGHAGVPGDGGQNRQGTGGYRGHGPPGLEPGEGVGHGWLQRVDDGWITAFRVEG